MFCFWGVVFGQNGILSPLNCIIVHGFLHLCFSACYLLVILHVFQPRSCWNCSVQKLGCLRHLWVHPSATKIVFHLPRLKLPRLKFLLTGKGKLFILLPPSLILCDLSFPTVASSSSVETTISLENMVSHNLCWHGMQH